MADRLFVIDGMAFAFRAYYAIRNLRNSRGEPTNAVFGFARVLLKLLREHDPSHIVVVFDAPGKTFRDDLYPAYKGNRDETPEELISQFPVIERLVKAFDIATLCVEGVEADDVMGTVARHAEQAGTETVLVTGDKDLLQLITPSVTVFDPNKGDDGRWYVRADVVERFGVPPEHVIDALGLMGDSADNVPGVRGIGEKTAKKLLEKYQTMEGLYAHVEELKGKQKEKLIEDRDIALLSRELVTIRCDVDVPIDLDGFARKTFDRKKLSALFGELEFRSLLEEFLPDASEEEKVDYQLVLSEEKLQTVVAEMRASGSFAVDTETTSVNALEAALVGVSLSCKAGTAYYIPVAHVPGLILEENAPVQAMAREEILEGLRPILEDEDLGKVGHNIKYDLVVLAGAGISLRGITLDTMVASYLTDPSRLRHNLEEVSLQYLKRKMIPIAGLIGKGSKAITFDKVPLDAACEYACEDADVTWRLAEVFEAAFRERDLESLFNDVELPLIPILARMEMAGIGLVPRVFEDLQRALKERIKALEDVIVELAGEPFQIHSPKQLQKVLFETLGLPPKRKTKTGYSTDVEVLEQLAAEHPLPGKVLEYRTLEKLRGTYVDALPKLVNAKTGRIHTSFNQAVAATGRLSSSDPNLQNIPIRTDLGKRIREGFVPSQAGWRLISADYSQIELRILAHLSGDANLREAFQNDVDIHRDTASRVFGVPAESVTADMRRQAKAVNFGIVYGISAFGLARNIGVSNSEAAGFIKQYFAQYPGVQDWIEHTKSEANRLGYVTTLMHRRRYVPELNSSDTTTRRAAERIVVNTPVQGTAADVIKIAMVRLDKALEDRPAQMLLQVHDELVVEAPEEESLDTAEIMRQAMEGACPLDVPLRVDTGIGENWAEIHERYPLTTTYGAPRYG